jgi:lipoprotein NlpI
LDKRGNQPSRLAQAVTQIDMTKWPAPIMRLYLGQMTAAQVLDAARNPNAKTEAGQVCEANFYTGELALQRRDTALATRLFRLAAAGCPKDFAEWSAARAELTGLGEKPN